jgi:hypothetical protein
MTYHRAMMPRTASTKMRLTVLSATGRRHEVEVNGTDSIGSLKDWLCQRDAYAVMMLKAGSKRLLYDFLTFDDYGIIDRSVVSAHGLPEGSNYEFYTHESQLNERQLREVAALREPPKNFGPGYVRYVEHDYRDTVGPGHVRAVVNREQEDPLLTEWRIGDDLRLSVHEQKEVRSLRQAAGRQQRALQEQDETMRRALARVEMLHEHQYSEAAKIWYSGRKRENPALGTVLVDDDEECRKALLTQPDYFRWANVGGP